MTPQTALRLVPDVKDVPSAGTLYGRMLATATGGGVPLLARVRAADGRLQPLPLAQYLGPLSWADHVVAGAVRGPVLDVGCGPGRLLEALGARGVPALGVDLSPIAVKIAQARGGLAHAGCVFGEVPCAGSFASALLLDGNVGIGGDPVALLERIGELLVPRGTVVLDIGGHGTPSRRERLRIEAHGEVSEWFAWATVSLDGLPALANQAGFTVHRRLNAGGRHLVWLRKAR